MRQLLEWADSIANANHSHQRVHMSKLGLSRGWLQHRFLPLLHTLLVRQWWHSSLHLLMLSLKTAYRSLPCTLWCMSGDEHVVTGIQLENREVLGYSIRFE